MTENDARWFDEVVSGLYQAGSGSRTWPDALRPIHEATGAQLLHLFGIDMQRGSMDFSFEVGDRSTEALLDFVRSYYRYDPRTRLIFGLPPGEWMHCHEHFDDDFVAGDRFYQDYLIPYGVRYSSGTKLVQEGTQMVVFGVNRGIGTRPLNTDEADLCRRLCSHLAVAIKIFMQNRELMAQAQVGRSLISRLAQPVFLMNTAREVIQANDSAQRLTAAGDGLLMRGNLLGCTDQRDDRALEAILGQFDPAPAGTAGSGASTRALLRVRRNDKNIPLALHIFALKPQSTMCVFGTTPSLMVMVHDPESPMQLDPLLLAATYDFTPAESRVASSLAKGLTPENIANTHGVAMPTVRSQMKSVFAKTGTSRQAELVSLLAATPANTFKI